MGRKERDDITPDFQKAVAAAVNAELSKRKTVKPKHRAKAAAVTATEGEDRAEQRKEKGAGGYDKSDSTPIHDLRRFPGNCYNCDQPGHPRNKCPKKRAKCDHCKKEGHLAKYCRTTVTEPRADKDKKKKKSFKADAKAVRAEVEDSSTEDDSNESDSDSDSSFQRFHAGSIRCVIGEPDDDDDDVADEPEVVEAMQLETECSESESLEAKDTAAPNQLTEPAPVAESKPGDVSASLQSASTEIPLRRPLPVSTQDESIARTRGESPCNSASSKYSYLEALTRRATGSRGPSPNQAVTRADANTVPNQSGRSTSRAQASRPNSATRSAVTTPKPAKKQPTASRTGRTQAVPITLYHNVPKPGTPATDRHRTLTSAMCPIGKY
jgi:hypothetical protein